MLFEYPCSSLLALLLGSLFGSAVSLLEMKNIRLANLSRRLNEHANELEEARILLSTRDERERQMLAADLHDQVLNDLKAVKACLDKTVKGSNGAGAREAVALLESAIDGVRDVMDGLYPSVLEHLGLPAAIEDYCQQAAIKAGFRVRSVSNIDEKTLERLTKLECASIFRLAQEAVNNICKHAAAKKVTSTFLIDGNDMLLTITDDGSGMWSRPSTRSRGLGYMRLRAKIIGARIAWFMGDGVAGTTVEIRKGLGARC